MMVVAIACGVALVGTTRLGMLAAGSIASGAGVGEKTAVLDALHTLHLLCLVAVLLVTFDFLSAVFDDRAARVGTLRAIGVQSDLLWRAIVGEGALVGAVGAAVGIALGVASSRLLLLVRQPEAVAGDSVARALAATETPAMLVAGAVGVATAVVAAALSAWYATRVPVAELMRGGGGALMTRGRRIFRRRLGVPRELAAPGMLHDPRRMLRTVVALGLALACVVWCGAMAERLLAFDPRSAAAAVVPLRLLVFSTLSIPLLGVIDTVFATALKCRHEVGTARALGARRAQLARVICVEALLVGSLGLVLAITLGVGLAAIRPAVDGAPPAASLGFGATAKGGV
jgi:hypothetical protein